jgi:hypothetical protein
VEVVKNAAQFFELTLLLCSGAGVVTLLRELSDLLLCVFAAADEFARDLADHIGEGSDKQHVRQDPDGVFFHADSSGVFEACSLSTRLMVARETM